jgi:RecA/RadA recombinase
MAKKDSLSPLNEALEKFNKTMGDGIIHTASVLPPCRKVLSTIPAYNYVSDGGYPVGRVIEHLGENGSLKSYCAYDAIAQFQHYDWGNHEQNAFTSFEYTGSGATRELKKYTLRRGYKPKNDPIVKRVALVDIEATYTPDWGENFGIDNEGLILIRPMLLSQCVDIVQMLLADENISLVVIDSLSAIGTDDEVDKSMEDNQMASGAKFWNKAFRKLQAAMLANPTAESSLLVINSAYQKVGIVYGDPENIRNGEQLKRTKSLSIKFKALKEISSKLEGGDAVVGKNITIKCVKSKVGRPSRDATFFYSYIDHGYNKACSTDVAGQLVDLGIRFNLIKRAGAWISYKDMKVQGIDAFSEELVVQKRLKELEKEVYAAMSNPKDCDEDDSED